MKIYDTHSDIFSNLYERIKNGEQNVFEKYHLNDLKKGEVAGGIWVVYSSRDFDVIEAYKIALEEYAPYKEQFDVVYGLEGLRNVKTLEELDTLYKMGIRHASLTWNEENHLATGVKGSTDRGLTELGKQFLDYMASHKMIVDVSHLNEKSFYDVIDYKPPLLIASHSNAAKLSVHMRNLTDEQLVALRSAGGLVGAVAARNFVSRDSQKQNIKGLVDQIEYLVKIMDVDHVMLGLDMMHYLIDYSPKPNQPNDNLDDLTKHADSQAIVAELKSRGYQDEDIEKICYKNFLNLKKKMGN